MMNTRAPPRAPMSGAAPRAVNLVDRMSRSHTPIDGRGSSYGYQSSSSSSSSYHPPHHYTADSGVPARQSIWRSMISDLTRVVRHPCCYLPCPDFIHDYIHGKKDRSKRRQSSVMHPSLREYQYNANPSMASSLSVPPPPSSSSSSAAADRSALDANNSSSSLSSSSSYLPIPPSSSSSVTSTANPSSSNGDNNAEYLSTPNLEVPPDLWDEVVTSLTDAQLNELRDAFVYCDQDRDGNINTGDLASVLRSMGQGVSEYECEEMMRDWSDNEIHSRNAYDRQYQYQYQYQYPGKTPVNFAAYLAIMSRKMRETEGDEELRQAFKVFDMDGSGYITVNQLKHLMASLGDPLNADEIDEMIRVADPDRDGFVNYEQFVHMLMSS